MRAKGRYLRDLFDAKAEDRVGCAVQCLCLPHAESRAQRPWVAPERPPLPLPIITILILFPFAFPQHTHKLLRYMLKCSNALGGQRETTTAAANHYLNAHTHTHQKERKNAQNTYMRTQTHTGIKHTNFALGSPRDTTTAADAVPFGIANHYNSYPMFAFVFLQHTHIHQPPPPFEFLIHASCSLS